MREKKKFRFAHLELHACVLHVPSKYQLKILLFEFDMASLNAGITLERVTRESTIQRT